MNRISLILLSISKIVLFLMIFLLPGCGREQTLLESAENLVGLQEPETKPGFELEQATLEVNGSVFTEGLTLSDESFTFFYLFLKNGGLFIVMIEPVHISIEAGNFEGNMLHLELNDYRIKLTSQGEHILSDAVDRKAYVVHIPEFNMFDQGIKPADLVVGFADDFKQIPGFDRN